MIELIASFPIYKPDRLGNEKFRNKVLKLFKKVKKRTTSPEIEEHNQFLIASVHLDPEHYEPLERREDIEARIRKIYTAHRQRTLKRIQKRFSIDPELESTVKAFSDIGSLPYVEITDKLMDLRALSITAEHEIERIYDNGMLIIWYEKEKDNPRIVSGNSILEVSEEESSLNYSDLSDELTLASFGMDHAPVILEQVGRIASHLDDFLKKIEEFANSIMEANSTEERQYLGEVASIVLGKILGIREPLASAKKQLQRYIDLEGEMWISNAQGVRVNIYSKFFDIKVLESTVKTIEDIEERISSNYEEIRAWLSRYYELPIGETDQHLVQEFSSFGARMYHTLDLFRLVTENFEDITNFTTITGKLSRVDELSDDEKREIGDYIIYGKGIFKSFPLLYSTVYALRGVDIRIKPGEFVAIMGPSGSGKTTLLNILSGLDKADKGIVSVAGIDVNTAGEGQLIRMRREIFSFIYQSYNLLPVLTNEENVQLPADFGGPKHIKDKRGRARMLLEKVGLGKYSRSRPILLSGGEQQRVTIARAFMNQPQILFCDEPTGDLDHRTGMQVMDLIEEFHKGGTAVVLVTHDIEVAKRADRIIRMQDGKIVQQ